MQPKRRKVEDATSSDGEVRGEMKRKYGIGAQLLAKMGYKEGSGLGKEGKGRTTPILVEQRPQGMGLGANAHVSSDSEESEVELVAHKAVEFESKGVESDTSKLADKIAKLEIAGVQLPPDILSVCSGTNALVSQRAAAMDKILSELLRVDDQLTTLHLREEQLQEAISGTARSNTSVEQVLDVLQRPATLPERVAAILALEDTETIDILCASSIREYFAECKDWDPLDPLDPCYLILLELVDVLSYVMDTSSATLNQTQTVIYNIVWEKLHDFWSNIDMRQGHVLAGVLLDYKTILDFVHCTDYIYGNYVSAQITRALKDWNVSELLTDHSAITDLVLILPPHILDEIQQLVQSKFTGYCSAWYHRDSPIPVPNIVFIRQILGEDTTEDISRRYLLPNFIDQLWEKYFDPTFELEDPTCTDGSLYFVARLRDCEDLLPSNEYQTILRAVFDTLNRILYQWHLFCPRGAAEARSWFNWYINSGFHAPTSAQIHEIKRTLRFLEDPSTPIHDEQFDLVAALGLAPESKETLQNVPLARVNVTFKEVVTDYCEAQGLLLEKTADVATLRVYQHARTVPVFTVAHLNRRRRVALCEDILWLQEEKGFKPMYLYELETLLARA
ncbi:AaceriAER107Wp [[Ashbya] aceris (nom. inval.)]|nr:AaceriAER107Wp [[Ashbya] aceris (nom. inval.)]